jgi:hypothetical protein
VAGNRHDDGVENGPLEFEFGDGGGRDSMSETVELARGGVAAPATRGPSNSPTRGLALLVVGAVALGVASFAIVSAVRGDGESSPPAAPATQTAQGATSPAGTTQTTTGAAATTPASPAVEALVPVAPEDEGEDVRRLQEALAALGFSVGEADGVYGAATVAAVAAFQRSAGLGEDGIAGAETIAALNAALAGG